MKYFFNVCLLITSFCNCVPTLSLSQNIDFWKETEILGQLKTGKIISKVPMQDFLRSQGKKVDFGGKVFLVELDNGLCAVFKSVPEDDTGDIYAEIAAYQASLVLGFPYVPPTVIRKVDGIQGSLQLYVDTPIDALVPDVYKRALEEADPEEVANLKVFYFVLGQWDTGPHNILILEQQGKKRLVAIDNSGIKQRQYVKYGELPFVSTNYSEALQTNDWWGVPFPFESAQTIDNPTPEKLKEIFGSKFPQIFYDSFKSYKRPLRYVIYQNAFWRQFHAFDEDFVKSYTPYISEKTQKALQALNLNTLREIFADARGADFLNDKYLQAILERRDQVLEKTKVVSKVD